MTIPTLTHFRIEPQANGLVHLVFDCPDKSMNVFSNRAIHELGQFAHWLQTSDVRGVVIRSGKSTGFCAGADLTELGAAYDMIVAAPAAERFDIAFNHFFPLSHAIRRLETAGKPVVAAISGVALGGGCELALGAHYRVASTGKRALLGLPECAVGLLPGAGGTQRMPRLVGIDLALDILLLGRTLQGADALAAGLVDALVTDGDEVAAAEAWLLSSDAHCIQPWDRPGFRPPAPTEIAPVLDACRARELDRMLGHEPAPLAILDCVAFGLVQQIDGAIRAEMSVFADLIRRREPRNMIRTMFLGKQAYEKALRENSLSECVVTAAKKISDAAAATLRAHPELARAGFGPMSPPPGLAQDRVGQGYWLSSQPALFEALHSLAATCVLAIAEQCDVERLQCDHAVVVAGAIPAYLGGVTGLVDLIMGPMPG